LAAFTRFAGRLGQSNETVIAPTRCGSSANSHRTSRVRSSTSSFTCVAQEYITENVQ